MSEAGLPELQSSLGQRLHFLRTFRELSQEQLAETIERTATFVSLIETGDAAPSFDTLLRLTKALNVEVMELFRFNKTYAQTKRRGRAVDISEEANLRTEFGKRLRFLRKMRAITQKQLAQSIGRSASFLRMIEKGLSRPSFETLARIPKALDVEIMEMFRFDKSLPWREGR